MSYGFIGKGERLRYAALIVAVVILDQATKLLVVRTLAIGESRPVLEGMLHLTHIRNPGAAFGFFREQPELLSLASLLGAVVFTVMIVRRPPPAISTGAALVAGGALGNLTDRLTRDFPFYGTVVDFIDVPYWPAFNVADAAISTGALLLVLVALFPGAREQAAEYAAPY